MRGACSWWCHRKCHLCPMLGCPRHSSPSLPVSLPYQTFLSCFPLSEPPVTMLRVPRDLGVLETGVASFECELSHPSAEVKWFKVRVHPHRLQHCLALPSLLRPTPCGGYEQGRRGQSSRMLPACNPECAVPEQDGQELRPGPNCRIYSAGRRRILQLSHCELADAGIYTCDAGDCCASATLHVRGTATQLPGACTPPSLHHPLPLALGCPGTLLLACRAPGPHRAGPTGHPGAGG